MCKKTHLDPPIMEVVERPASPGGGLDDQVADTQFPDAGLHLFADLHHAVDPVAYDQGIYIAPLENGQGPPVQMVAPHLLP